MREQLGEVFAKHVDQDTHYPSERWQQIRFSQRHLGVMKSVQKWLIIRDGDANTGADNTLMLSRRFTRIVPTMEREGLMMSMPGSLPIFVPYPKRSDDVFQIDAGDPASKWLSVNIGIPCRLVCVYRQPGEEAQSRPALVLPRLVA